MENLLMAGAIAAVVVLLLAVALKATEQRLRSRDLYNGKLNLRIPKSLHRKLAESAKREGVKLNQLAIYLMANGIGEQEKNS